MEWYDTKGIDRETKNSLQRAVRLANGNAYTRTYEKKPKGFLMRLYRNMESRVTGVQKTKFHLYRNLTILDREAFYKWALNNPDFYMLYADWFRSGFDQKLTPSIDRIDSRKGYIFSNMRWVTHSENSALITPQARMKYKKAHPKTLSSPPPIRHRIKSNFLT